MVSRNHPRCLVWLWRHLRRHLDPFCCRRLACVVPHLLALASSSSFFPLCILSSFAHNIALLVFGTNRLPHIHLKRNRVRSVSIHKEKAVCLQNISPVLGSRGHPRQHLNRREVISSWVHIDKTVYLLSIRIWRWPVSVLVKGAFDARCAAGFDVIFFPAFSRP